MANVKNEAKEEKKESLDDLVTVVIPYVEGEEEEVFISVNNYTAIVKKDEEVTIPRFAYEAYKLTERQKKENRETMRKMKKE